MDIYIYNISISLIEGCPNLHLVIQCLDIYIYIYIYMYIYMNIYVYNCMNWGAPIWMCAVRWCLSAKCTCGTESVEICYFPFSKLSLLHFMVYFLLRLSPFCCVFLISRGIITIYLYRRTHNSIDFDEGAIMNHI